MQLYKSLIILLTAAHCFISGFTQDVGFSQFYDQPLLRNPALAGIFTGDVRLGASFRNQWQSVTVPYRTYSLSSELKLPVNVTEDDNLTLGLQLLRDVAGTSQYSTVKILPAVNYSLPLSAETNSYLSIGFMGGLMQQRFDPTKLVLNDQFVEGSNGSFSISPVSRQVFNNTSVNYFDLSMGVSYNGVYNDIDYYVGAGIFHVTKPQVGFFEGNKILLNKKLALNAGIAAPTSETDQFIVYGDYFKQFGDGFSPVGISTAQAGFLFSRDLFVMDDISKTISGGLLYRWNDALIPVVQLQLSKFVVGISYDINVSKLTVASQSRGGLELVLTYRDWLNYRNKEQRQVLCPRFGRQNIIY